MRWQFFRPRLATAEVRSGSRPMQYGALQWRTLSARFVFLTILTVGGPVFDTPNAASAQTPQYVPVTTDSLRYLAEGLKQDLQNGSILLADVHGLQLRMALLGVLKEDMSASVSALEQLPAVDKPAPQLTSGLVPLADKLIQALDEPDLGLAKSYSEQLAAQIHARHELYRREQMESGAGDIDFNVYLKLTRQLRESLQKGDIPAAAVLAAEVQNAGDLLVAKKKPLPISVVSENIYDINDALGRAAFLRKDYPAACDYLLKAADTPGKHPALLSFGPDLWLARALLAQGYKDVVLTFLQRCKAFWSPPRLDEWISVLESGGVPDFRQNIFSNEPMLSR